MTDRPPTFRERAIATSATNCSQLRDLVIAMCSELDNMLEKTEAPETETETTTEPTPDSGE